MEATFNTCKLKIKLSIFEQCFKKQLDSAETADRDDISDSGVTSLSPCDDFYLDFDSILDTKLVSNLLSIM